jgi:C4-dicarboxylate-specific signal transduction histidine kinase
MKQAFKLIRQSSIQSQKLALLGVRQQAVAAAFNRPLFGSSVLSGSNTLFNTPKRFFAASKHFYLPDCVSLVTQDVPTMGDSISEGVV